LYIKTFAIYIEHSYDKNTGKAQDFEGFLIGIVENEIIQIYNIINQPYRNG
jgi:hypothetical protein